MHGWRFTDDSPSSDELPPSQLSFDGDCSVTGFHVVVGSSAVEVTTQDPWLPLLLSGTVLPATNVQICDVEPQPRLVMSLSPTGVAVALTSATEDAVTVPFEIPNIPPNGRLTGALTTALAS